MYQLVLPDVLCRSPIVICKKKTKDLFSNELNIFSNYWCSRNMTLQNIMLHSFKLPASHGDGAELCEGEQYHP